MSVPFSESFIFSGVGLSFAVLNIEAHSAEPALRIAKSLEVLSDNVRSSGSSVATIPSKNTLAATATSNLAEVYPRGNILEPTRYKLYLRRPQEQGNFEDRAKAAAKAADGASSISEAPGSTLSKPVE
jgi:hypothetical protein